VKTQKIDDAVSALGGDLRQHEEVIESYNDIYGTPHLRVSRTWRSTLSSRNLSASPLIREGEASFNPA